MQNRNILHIKYLIDKYGKDLINKFIEFMIIHDKNIDNTIMRSLLLKHKVIKRSTKIIQNNIYTNVYPSGYRANQPTYNLRIVNGRNQTIISITLAQSELPEVYEMLNAS